MRVGKNTPWLVKSAGRIIGPFYEREIAGLLKTREIVILDEICRPCGRWTYIRDEPSFASVVEEIRRKAMRMSDDADDSTLANQTASLSKTHTITDSITLKQDDLTDEIPVNSKAKTEDIFYRSVEDTAKKYESADSYVFEGDAGVLAEGQRSAKSLWVVTIILICLSISYVVFNRLIVNPKEEMALNNQAKENAFYYLELGSYDQALREFKSAHELAPEDLSIYLPLALLSIQIDGQTLLGRRLLNRILSEGTRDRERALNALGLADLFDNKINSSETNFNSALEINPLYTSAVVNLGAVALKREDYPRANNHLQLAVKDGSREGPEHLMLTASLLSRYENEKSESYLLTALEHVEDYLRRTQEPMRELLVASIYLNHLLGRHDVIEFKVDQFLDLDPRASSFKKRNIEIYTGLIGWSEILDWCAESISDRPLTARLNAFEGACLFEAGQRAEAVRKLSSATVQSPRDPLVQSMFGYVQIETGLYEAGQVAVERALDFDIEKRYQSPRINQIRLCKSRGDQACALMYAQELRSINERSLVAITEQARVHLENHQLGEAKKLIDEGKRFSSQYIPLLEVEKKYSDLLDRVN